MTAAAKPETLAANPHLAEADRLKQALALAEHDRQLLGYEIHDGIVQDLAAAVMLLEGAGNAATFSAPQAAENYAAGLRMLREGITEARRIISGLAAVEGISGGLDSALDRLVSKFRSDLSLPVVYQCEDGGRRPLPASVQHVLLRITQEALFNTWKHTRATQVEVTLKSDSEQLELTISDNGQGFDAHKIPKGHFGLEGMRTRVNVLQPGLRADLQIESAPGQGTRVIVRLNGLSAL